MRRRAVAILAAGSAALSAAAACSSFDSAPAASSDAGNDVGNATPPPTGSPPAPPPASDAAPDAGPTCDPSKPFGVAQPLPVDAINTAQNEDAPHLSDDELTLVFSRDGDLHRSFRTSRDQPFPASGKMGIASGLDGTPWISPDGLVLVYSSFRTIAWHLWRATRANVSSDFVAPVMIPTPPPLEPFQPLVAPNAAGGQDVWFVSRVAGDAASPFAIYALPYPGDAAADAASLVPTRIDVVDGSSSEYPVLSPDGLTLFVTVRPPSNLEYDISVAKRSSLGGAFAAPAPVSELNTAGHPEHPGWVSPDGCRIYFSSGRLSSNDIYVSERGK
jgi:hypothetical protein